MSKCKECGFDGWHDRCCSTQFTKPAPSAEPETPTDRILCIDHTGKWMCWLKLDDLREALSRVGLAIVPAADVVTAEERKVLEASSEAPESELQLLISMPGHPSWEVEHARAELARRAAAAKAAEKSRRETGDW